MYDTRFIIFQHGMPGGKTRFKQDWLKSDHDCRLKEWCRASTTSKYAGYCFVCESEVRVDNQGLRQLKQHANKAGHKSRMDDLLGDSQTSLTSETVPSTSQDQPAKMLSTCFSRSDQATRAELLWAMKVVHSHYSFSSCDGVKELFQAMFPGEAENFTMSSSKVSYLISEATGPYFHDKMIDDINKSDAYFTVMYDETTNDQNKKQMEIYVRYWSEEKGEVVSHHLRTYLIGHAATGDLEERIIGAIEESKLKLSRLLMLGSDGPNVNKAVWRKIDQQMTDAYKIRLIDTDTCVLHKFHNSFSKGLKEFGSSAADLNNEIVFWFQGSAARKVDLHDLQVRLGRTALEPMKFVDCRWLSLGPAATRLLEIWESVREYFLVYIPKNFPEHMTKPRYVKIRAGLQQPTMLTILNFLSFAAATFDDVLVPLQSRQTMIHVLHDRMVEFLRKLINRILNTERSANQSVKDVNVCLAEDQLELNEIGIGDSTRACLTKLNQALQRQVLLGVQKFYVSVIVYLQKVLPLMNPIIRDASVFQPKKKDAKSVDAMRRLAKAIGRDVDCDRLMDEWKLFLMDDNVSTEAVVSVDQYWANVFKEKNSQGEPKYKQLGNLGKKVLSLSHGNSEVERAFSISGNDVTPQRSCLSESTINGIGATTSGIRADGGMPEVIPITKEFIRLGRQAHRSYKMRLEEEQRQREEERKKRELAGKELEEQRKNALLEDIRSQKISKKTNKLKEKEARLEKEEESSTQLLKTGNELLTEANDKLKTAVKVNDKTQIAVAQAMIETAESKLKQAQNEFTKTRATQRKVEKKKLTMIEAFVLKKKRTS